MISILTIPLFLAAGFFSSPPRQRSLPLRGMCLSLHAREKGYNYEKLVDEIAALGVANVSVLVAGYQETIKSQVIHKNSGGVPDRAEVKKIINYIHSMNMSVMLFPIVLIRKVETDEDWRGGIRPGSWKKWFAEYTKFITYYAKIARETNVEFFSVGSELISTEVFRERWYEVIGAVRKVYKGKLLYSANWDHYSGVPFWDKLDYVGMTSYYTLTDTKNPTMAELVEAWEGIRDDIKKWKTENDRKIILTEVGYPSQDGCNKFPWNYYSTQAVDLEEQAMCFQAFIKVCGADRTFDGIYIFEWWGEGGLKDYSYTPRGKPAEKILKAWFKQK